MPKHLINALAVIAAESLGLSAFILPLQARSVEGNAAALVMESPVFQKAIAFGISPQIAYAQIHSHLTDEELQKLMPDFQRQVEYWNQYEEPERQSEARAFAENWLRRDPIVAPFLGQWAAIEETMDIYPSTTEGQVCIIYTDGTAQVVDFELGNVLNQQIYTDGGGITFQQGNYVGVAWNNNNPSGEAGVYAYRLIAPADVPTRAYWRDWDEGDRVIEQFNAAGCIAEASNEALEQRQIGASAVSARICTRDPDSNVTLRTSPGMDHPMGFVQVGSGGVRIDNYFRQRNYTIEDGEEVSVFSKTHGTDGRVWYEIGTNQWVAWVRSDFVCQSPSKF